MGGNDFSELSGTKTYCSEPQLWTTEFDVRPGKGCRDKFCKGCRVPLQSATCFGAERHTCSNGCTLSHFQILMNWAAVSCLFHGAAMAPAESAEDRGTWSHMRNNGFCRGCRVLLLNAAQCAAKNSCSRIYKLSTSNLKDSHISHPSSVGLAPFCGTIAGHKIRQFKKASSRFISLP